MPKVYHKFSKITFTHIFFNVQVNLLFFQCAGKFVCREICYLDYLIDLKKRLYQLEATLTIQPCCTQNSQNSMEFWLKLYGVLAELSAIGLNTINVFLFLLT